MAAELVLDASVSLAWFLKETAERAAYAAAVNALAADGAVLHVPVQWGIEMGHVLLREHRRGVLNRRKLLEAIEDLNSFDVRIHFELFTARRIVEFARRYHLQGYDALYFDLARNLDLPLATLDHGHRQASFCILCGLCVRYCAEIKQKNVVGFIEGGGRRQISFIAEIAAKECWDCQECFAICPTSAAQAAYFLTEALAFPGRRKASSHSA